MIIKINNVYKKYKNSNFFLDNISFNISEKEIIGILGENGSGKSTVLKMLNALENYDSGSIKFYDENIHEMNYTKLKNLRKNVSYIFQNFNLLENKSVLYNLKLAYKLNNTKVNMEEIDTILDFMNLKQYKNTLCFNLSGGQQQKIAISMSILQNMKVLLCDEITSALDINSEKEIIELLKKLVEEKNISIVIVSHNLNLIKNLCDKVIILENGKIKEICYPKKSLQNENKYNYVNYVKGYLEND